MKDRTACCRHVRYAPEINHQQNAEGVRKFVTLKYCWLIHCTLNEAAGEIVILNVKHSPPTRSRGRIIP
jgi:hypothetical protein